MSVVQIVEPVEVDLIRARERVEVQIKRTWAAEWVSVPYLEPIECAARIAPGVSSATLRHRYGAIKREDAASFDHEEPLSLAGSYVRIARVLGDTRVPVWVGVVADETHRLHGPDAVGPQGDLTIACYGLEHLLDRSPILGARAAGLSGDTVAIDAAPTFNDRARHGVTGPVGNRSSAVGPEDVHRFSRDGELWTHLDVLEYVLAYFAPPEVEFVATGAWAALDDIVSVLDLDGVTLRDALNYLVDRRRGLGWCLRTDGAGVVAVHIFTVLDAPVAVGSVIVPANGELTEFRFDDAIDIDQAIVTVSRAQEFDEVVVRGAPTVSCFTLSFADGTLERAWSDAEQAAYEAGTGIDGDDAALHDAERSGDRWERVFRVFRAPAAWAWTAGNGAGDVPIAVTPAFDAMARYDEGLAAPVWGFPRALHRWLPLPKPTSATDAEPEQLAPLAFVELADGSGFAAVDALDAHGLSPASLRMRDCELAVELHARLPHAFGLDTFDSDTAAPSAVDPEVDYRTLVVTVALATDTRPTVTVATGAAPAPEVLRRLVLDVCDAQTWYVVPKTVVGVAQGVLQHHAGGLVRDDTERLRVVAALARAWYGRPRAVVQVALRSLTAPASPGAMLLSASSSTLRHDVGTVVSEVRHDFVARTCSIATEYSNIDVLRERSGVL